MGQAFKIVKIKASKATDSLNRHCDFLELSTKTLYPTTVWLNSLDFALQEGDEIECSLREAKEYKGQKQWSVGLDHISPLTKPTPKPATVQKSTPLPPSNNGGVDWDGKEKRDFIGRAIMYASGCFEPRTNEDGKTALDRWLEIKDLALTEILPTIYGEKK